MEFVQASSFRQANRGRGDIERVVWHTAEIEEGPSSAEAIAAFFARPSTEVSSHVVADTNTIVRCVRDEDIAFHALGDNDQTLGIELAARAGQTRAQWRDTASMKMLEIACQWAADVCERYDIPVRWLTKTQEADRVRGFVTHAVVSDVFGEGIRSDPGEHFPYVFVEKRVRQLMADKVQFTVWDGEGKMIAESASVEQGFDRELARLESFDNVTRARRLKELREDRDIVIRRRKAP